MCCAYIHRLTCACDARGFNFGIMQNERFSVQYITVNNCFVYLPEEWLRKLTSRPNVVKVQHNDVNYYLSWYTRPSPDNSRLCLSATFARTLNIKEGDEVFVSCAEEAPPLTSLVVAPKSSHDRQILELQSENIQVNLLNQITIVAKNQTIVAWVSKYLSVTLIVKSLNPVFLYGRLGELTEVHVGDAADTSIRNNPIPSKSDNVIAHILNQSLRSFRTISRPRTFRVHLLPLLDDTPVQPFLAFVPRSQLPIEVNKKSRVYRVRKIREDRQHVKSTTAVYPRRVDFNQELMILICPLDDYISKFPVNTEQNNFLSFKGHPCIYMSKDLMKNLRIKIGGKVVLDLIDELADTVDCTSIHVIPTESISEKLFYNYVHCLSRDEKLLLNTNSVITINDKIQCMVKLLPENCPYGFFNEVVLKKVNIKIDDISNFEDDRSMLENVQDLEVSIKSVAIELLQPVITECKTALTLSLGLHDVADFDYQRENILINGATGSGKTTICKLLYEILSNPPYCVHTRLIDCRSLKGKKVEVLQKLLATEISHAVYYQPTVIFFDDIESITCSNSNTEENTPDSMNAARITDVICNTITEYQTTNHISIVATCTDTRKVGKKLKEARGTHFFRTILMLPSLEKEERIKILRSSLQDKLYLAKEIDWDHYGNKTEGWVAQDLVVLADKAAFTAWKRHVKEKKEACLNLCELDLAMSLERCTPQALRGLNLYRGTGHCWSDIGGLSAVKSVLVEILDWPLTYPRIFKSAPIKLQSGVLLYGMPGTGKTMLAGAIARECRLNLISVKGPELLSKYIGASEEAVRNLFEKAQRAKPCVLFFDEFDSLAPRRGHDSTGVTDRVVNQLLTHLDGIEGREGVAVVAASSRPDLLDPALLRPGRLDKSLLCPLPEENDREEILNALCRVHAIDSQDLDLKVAAALTSGFTGADLNAVLVQARLNLIEEAMEFSSTAIGKQPNYDKERVTQKHLIESIKSSKPSLLTLEKEKYKRIYAKFAKSEGYPVDELKHQKATLA